MIKKPDESLTYKLLIKPYFKRILHDWAFRFAFATIFGFAALTRFLPFESRADIVRNTISLSVPLVVALLAIVVAAFTIFSTLATDVFRESLKENYDYLTSFFFMTMMATIATSIYSVLLFLMTYSVVVLQSDAFFWACMVGLGSLVFCFLQVLDAGRSVSLQALTLRKLAKTASVNCSKTIHCSKHEKPQDQ